MNSLIFQKMHALNNDFMIIDFTIQEAIELPTKFIQAMSHRKSGIGFDQLLTISKSTSSSCDFLYRIYNADGSEAQQCGNGARCITKYLFESEGTSKKTIHFETNGKNFSAEYLASNEISIYLAPPSFQNKELPCLASTNPHRISVNKMDLELWFVSVGNPHAIIFEPLKKTTIRTLAPKLAKLDIFPEGINLNFCTPLSRESASLIVYERGSGFTEACGSGACATMVAGRNIDIFDKTVSIQQAGGTLLIEWNGKPRSKIKMSGDACYIYEGQLYL